MKRFTALAVAVLMILCLAGYSQAVTFGDEVTFDNNVTMKGTNTLSGANTFSNTVTLDDGSGASPSFILKDATDETGAFSKVDAGYVTFTSVAGDGFNILTGNLKVGNGTPDQSVNGEDAYIEGLLEVDGDVYFDGANFTLWNGEKIDNSTNGEVIFITDTANADTISIAPKTGGGATYKGTITSADLTAAKTWTLPNVTGQIAILTSNTTISASTTVNQDFSVGNVFTDTTNDNQDQTINATAVGASGTMITIIFVSTSTGDEVITFGTSMHSTGTLTVSTTANRYYLVTFISNGTAYFEISRTAVQT